ncbi:hypothetical protein GCM10009785_06920 [Brooklawnia cerclae]|uniref:sensor histidine kinase n=1 Tax=Brooklawnia cerclae TaxID=349934 RepID=UPI0031E0C67D
MTAGTRFERTDRADESSGGFDSWWTSFGPARANLPRIVICMLALLGLVDALRGAIVEPKPASTLVALLVGYAAMALVPWFVYVGSAMALVPLSIALARGQITGVEPFLIATCVVMWTAVAPKALAAVGIVTVLAWSAAIAVHTQMLVLWLMLLIVGVAAAAGLGIRFMLRSHQRLREQYRRVLAENERIRVDERTQLSRELHDIVAHQLSLVSLQVVGHRDADDIEELRQAMDRIQVASHAALIELAGLVDSLRDAPGDELTPDQLRNLSVREIPTQMVASLSERLTDQGLRVRTEIDPAVDDLDMILRQTVVRILREACTNALRYAAPGSTVSLRIAVGPTEVDVKVTNVRHPKGGESDLSTGWGLRGLSERVRLVGGQFTAGAEGDDWVVHTTLPRR